MNRQPKRCPQGHAWTAEVLYDDGGSFVCPCGAYRWTAPWWWRALRALGVI